jgi:hypothetical protein
MYRQSSDLAVTVHRAFAAHDFTVVPMRGSSDLFLLALKSRRSLFVCLYEGCSVRTENEIFYDIPSLFCIVTRSYLFKIGSSELNTLIPALMTHQRHG